MRRFSFTVHGLPKGQPRPRAFARKMGDKFVARVYDAGTAENWKQAVAMEWKKLGIEPLDGALEVELVFFMPRPKSHYTSKGETKWNAPDHYTSKPDCDNLAKAVLDCLTQIGAWKDDSQIIRLSISKHYEGNGYVPGVKIYAEKVF